MPLKCAKCGKTHVSTYPCRKPHNDAARPSQPETEGEIGRQPELVDSPSEQPPVAPGEQPPKFLTCLSCGLSEPSCKCKRNPANENSAMGTPAAQERASEFGDWWKENGYRLMCTDNDYKVVAEAAWATAAKLAHAAGRLHEFEFMKANRPIDPTYWDKHHLEDLQAALAAQPSPQTRLSNREEGKK